MQRSYSITGKGEGEKRNAGCGGWLYGVLLLLGFLTLVLALRVRVCQFPIGYVSHRMVQFDILH